jgi:hypothetical protein
MGNKSWAWDKIVIDVAQIESNPFQDDFLHWMHSPARELSEDALDTVWPLLETTQVDAKGRKFLRPDGKRLGIAHTVRRIYKDHPELGRELIEDKVISWLEMGYVPENYSQQQLDDLEQLVDRWIECHQRQSRRAKNRLRTRYS